MNVCPAVVSPFRVTVTLAAPLPAGVMAVMEVALTTVTDVAETPPTETVAPAAN